MKSIFAIDKILRKRHNSLKTKKIRGIRRNSVRKKNFLETQKEKENFCGKLWRLRNMNPAEKLQELVNILSSREERPLRWFSAWEVSQLKKLDSLGAWFSLGTNKQRRLPGYFVHDLTCVLTQAIQYFSPELLILLIMSSVPEQIGFVIRVIASFSL